MTTPIATAYVEIVPDLSKFSAQLRRETDAALRNLSTSLRSQFTTPFIQQTRQASRGFQDIKKGADGLGVSLQKLGVSAKGIPGVTTAVQALGTALGAAAAAAVGVGVAASTIGLKGASDVQALNIRFTALKDNLQLGDQSVQAFVQSLRDLELQTGLSTSALANAVTRFTSLGTSAQGAVRLTTIFGDALATLGLSGGNLTNILNSVITQLSQAASVGKFGGDELKSVLENLGGLVSRSDIIARVAANTGKSIGDVAKELNDGALGFGEGFTALVEDLSDPKKGFAGALERQAKTLPGVVNRIKATIRQGLEDAFLPQLTGLADSLDAALEASKPALAAFGDSIAGGFAAIAPDVIAALPDIVNGLAFTFQTLAPLIGKAAAAAAGLAAAFVDHKDEIDSVASSLGDFLGGIGALHLEDIFEPMLREIGLVITILGYLGEAVQFLEPVFKFISPIAANIFTPLTNSIDFALHALEQLLEGFGLIPSKIPGLGGLADQADEAAAKIHAIREQLAGIDGSVATATIRLQVFEVGAGQVGSFNVGSGGDALATPLNFNEELRRQKKAAEDSLKASLPKFPTGASTSSAGGAAAKKAADDIKRGMETVKKELASLGKATSDQSVEEIRRSFDQLVAGLKDAGLKEYVKQVRAVEKTLVSLAKQRDKLNDQLKDATADLKKLTDEQTAFAESVRGTVNALGDVSQATGVISTTFNGIRGHLVGAIRTTAQFSAAIDALTKEGLNATSLRQLIDAGPAAGLAAAQALARAGQAAITGPRGINDLQATLDAQGKALGTSTSHTLFDAGVAMGQSIVLGLQSQEAAIEKQMNRIADKLVAAIKKPLKMHSPSQVLADEVGRPAGQGIIQGLIREIDRASSVSNSVRNYASNVNVGGIVVNGVQDPERARRAGLMAGHGIASVLEERARAAALAGVG